MWTPLFPEAVEKPRTPVSLRRREKRLVCALVKSQAWLFGIREREKLLVGGLVPEYSLIHEQFNHGAALMSEVSCPYLPAQQTRTTDRNHTLEV